MDHPSNTLLTIVTLSVLTPFVLGDGVVPRQVLRPYCSHTCGNVSIPYPFGIEDGCYLVDDEFDYKFVCNDTYTPPRLILGTNWEVLKVSLEGELTINNFVSFACYNNSSQGQFLNRFWSWVNLVRFPVSTTKNVFIAIGCDTYVQFSGFRQGRPYEIGCMTQCSSLEDVVDGACDGIGCCETTLPEGVSNMTIRVRSFSNHSLVPFNPCSSAFPVEREKFKFYQRNLTQDSNYYLRNDIKLPIIFNWTVGTVSCSVAKADSRSYMCTENTECYDTEHEIGYRCKCKHGYSGNPYLSQGCTDIDECKEANDCEKAEYCINTNGGYYCKCPKGHHGNGTSTNRCVSNRKAYWLTPVLATTGFTLALIILIPIGWWLYSANKRRQAIKQREKYFERNGGMLLQQQMSSNGSVVDRIRIFPINELEKATDHFNEDRILGHGGHGTVYKGMLHEGRIVAVKKSNILKESERGEFINEVVILSQINHRNILKLLGCCLETEVPLLVYEFIPNGTLFHHIHNPSEDFPITWKMRLQIASDSAGALAYLHSSSSTLIYHRDIKSSNILLDDKYRAKLSDFGTSRAVDVDQTRIVTRVMGTFGYMDPEYFQSHQYTEKSDVYSFGVVLVELLTGQKAVRAASEQDRSLTAWFLSHMENSCVFDILDYQVHERSASGIRCGLVTSCAANKWFKEANICANV